MEPVQSGKKSALRMFDINETVAVNVAGVDHFAGGSEVCRESPGLLDEFPPNSTGAVRAAGPRLTRGGPLSARADCKKLSNSTWLSNPPLGAFNWKVVTSVGSRLFSVAR